MVSGFFSEEKVSRGSRTGEYLGSRLGLCKPQENRKKLQRALPLPFGKDSLPLWSMKRNRSFHCFGCGEGGDVFTFLMKVGHFSFPQAVEMLAKRYGVKLPSRELSPGQKKELAKRDLLFQINEAASEYYHDLLTRQKEGEDARRYLSQRGIREEVIRNTGWVTPSIDGTDLVQHLQGEKASSRDGLGNSASSFPRRKRAGMTPSGEGFSFRSLTSINGSLDSAEGL